MGGTIWRGDPASALSCAASPGEDAGRIEAEAQAITDARVIFLGTGDAFSTDARISAGTLIEWGGRRLLVDPGPAVLHSLVERGVAVRDLDAVFVTHLHGDHILGIPFLMLRRGYVEGAASPGSETIRIHGPQGSAARFEQLWQATYPETRGAAALEVVEVPRRHHRFEILDGDLAVEIVPMVHLPHSLGFRFFLRHGDRAVASVALSGDTAYGRCVEELADGVDLLVLECTLMQKMRYTHVSLEEVRAGRDRLRCRHLVINHTTDEVARALAASPLPQTSVASDGSEILVPVALPGGLHRS